MAETQTPPGQTASFADDFIACWHRVPNKAFFFALLAAWLLLFQFVGSGVFAYVDTPSLFQWLWKQYWNPSPDNDDGLGVLVPVVVLALFWWKRKEILEVPARLWWPALVLLGGCLLLHVVGYLIQVPRISAVALFCGLYALMGLAWGPAWLRRSFFPFFLFVFAVPITGVGGPVASLTFHLRLLVSQLVTGFCNTGLGIDVHREGTQLSNSARTYGYDVAAACSGLKSLIAITALCTTYGFITFQKNWKRLLMMAASVPLAVLGNMLRLLAIVIAAEMDGEKAGQFVHDNSVCSLLPYVPAILGIALLGHWLREKPGEPLLSVNPTP